MVRNAALDQDPAGEYYKLFTSTSRQLTSNPLYIIQIILSHAAKLNSYILTPKQIKTLKLKAQQLAAYIKMPTGH